MAELKLEPYAVVQRWRLPGVDPKWEEILSEYLQSLAQECQQEAGNFIGHIKALALSGEDQYLRISVTDPGRPASVEGSVLAGQNSLELTLNVIVYGLGHDFLKQITEKRAAEIAAKWNGEVNSRTIHQHEI